MRFAKPLLVFVLSLAVVASSLLSACSTPVSAEEITNKTIDASALVQTFKCEMNMTMEMSGVSGTDSLDATFTGSYTAWMDYTLQQMKLTLDYSITASGQGEQSLSMQMYVLDGWDYYYTDLFGSGAGWMKSPDDGSTLDSQDQLAQQIQFLKTAVETKSVGSEKVDGVDCYILEIGPDVNALADWLASQDEGTGLFASGGSDLPGLFKNVTIKIWVAKSSFLPVKETLEMSMDVTPQDFDPSSTETGHVTMTISARVKYYDYNKPLNIVLPAEAAAATDVTFGYYP